MNPKICPTCHAPIPADAPGGFCPACLLRDAEEPPATSHDAPPLEQIAAAFPQWEIIRLIGQGGMGFVYQVRQPALDRTVALKILSPELGRDPAFAERFAREARALGKLSHPNIVAVFEHGESAGFFYLLMEFVDGVNLRQAMRAGRLTPEQALAIVPGICDALQAAHAQGIWHRDIKPENILLDAHGGVKIADFGIARIIGDPQRDFTLTLTGGALGSAAYMAPEQHENPRGVDHRADIYSLGVVIYEMLTGELPLGRFPAPSQRAAVSARIDEIVFRTLEKERELRQQSATEVKTEVESAVLQPATVRPARPDPPAPMSRRSLALMAGSTALLAAVALIWIVTDGWGAPMRRQNVANDIVTRKLEAEAVQQLIHWRVALPNDPNRTYVLGPVIERVLLAPGPGVACMLDFKHGQLHTPGNDLAERLKGGGASYAAAHGIANWPQVTWDRHRSLAEMNAVATMPDCSWIQFFRRCRFPWMEKSSTRFPQRRLSIR